LYQNLAFLKELQVFQKMICLCYVRPFSNAILGGGQGLLGTALVSGCL